MKGLHNIKITIKTNSGWVDKLNESFVKVNTYFIIYYYVYRVKILHINPIIAMTLLSFTQQEQNSGNKGNVLTKLVPK